MDTTSAIAFVEEMGRPDLLDQLGALGYKLELPPSVQIELKSDATRKRIEFIPGVRFLTSGAPAEHGLKARFPQLGAGEISVLARAQELMTQEIPFTCVLDDGRARRAAEKLGLPLTGTLGLLQRLQQRGKISETERKGIISKLKQAGFRLPPGA